MIEHGSGMMRQVADLVRAEQRLGLDSGVVCTTEANRYGVGKDGKQLEAFGVKLSTWKWAYELERKDTVHVIHSHPPANLATMENSVVVLHGTPEHVVFRQLWSRTHSSHIPWTTSVNLIQMADIAVTLVPRHKQYWDAFAHKDNVVAIEGGVDVDEFRPEWLLSDSEREEYARKNVLPVFPFSAKPAVFNCESPYEIKVPTVVLIAIKEVVKRLPSARLSIINLKGVEGFWMDFVRKGYIDMYCDMFLADKVCFLETYYRGAHVYASPVLMGDMSRCGMEALACGAPVVAVKADENPVNGWSAPHNPSDFADKIVQIYGELQDDERKVREKARKLAEDHFNINTTVKQLEEKVYNRLTGG